jgi:hypothetical protein
LTELQTHYPDEEEVSRLLQTAREDQAEQEREQNLDRARNLLAARRYDECRSLLAELQKAFPNNDEVSDLLQDLREDEANQRKLQRLAEARSLLASRAFDECIALLTELQKAFPEENDITKLLEAAREEQADQQKQQKLVEARSLFGAERFDDALTLLEALGTAYPKDSGVQKLRTAVMQEKEKRAQAEKLKSDIAVLKKLVSEKKYPEVLARADDLVVEYFASADLQRLIEFARSQQAEIEREHAVKKALDEGKSLLKANRFDEAARAIQTGLKAHSDNRELLNLREQVETQRRKSFTRQDIEQRIREIKVKINREKFSEAIDLAKRTIATIGPDTDVTQLLNSAQVEIEARERKRDQEKTIESIRELVQAGQFDEAARSLDGAVSKKLFDPFDSRAQRAAEEILAGRNAAKRESSPPAPVPPGNLTKEYAFLQAPPVADAPPTFDTLTSADAPGARGSTAPQVSSGPPAPAPVIEPAQPKKTVQGSTPGVAEPPAPKISERTQPAKPTRPVSPIGPPKIAEPVKTRAPVKPPRTAQPTPPVVPAGPAKTGPPAEPAPQVERPTPKPFAPVTAEPEYHEERKKKPVLTAVLALLAVLFLVGAYLLWPKPEVKLHPSAPSKSVSPGKAVDPLEVKQQDAIHAAEKLVAAGDLKGALQTVLDAEKLNGPRTTDLQKMQGQIEDSIKNAGLRQVRQREAQLWQQASDNMTAQRYAEAQKDLRQLLDLPEGGVHRDEAQSYLTGVIPKLQQQHKLLTQAQQALRQGDFNSARKFASQVQQSGGDTSQLNGEIDKSEADRLAQLESQFRQLKEADDDASVQRLKTLQTKFKALATDGGPKAAEAQTYFEKTPAAMLDVQTRAQNKRLELAFQSAVQKYQQAINGTDRNALTSARESLQPFAQGGPHAGEAQKYLGEVNTKLTAMNKPSTTPPAVQPPPVSNAKRETPPPSPVESDADVRAVVQRYQQAFEHRDADALRRIWPSLGDRYKKYKQIFGAASSIQLQVEIVEVKMGSGGASATVRAVVVQDYTPKGSKTMSSKDQTIFHMIKSNGNWLIEQIQ